MYLSFTLRARDDCFKSLISSVVSISLLNLSHSLLFLSLSSLIAMLHHVFWLSVFTVYLLHVTLVYPGVGFPCSHHGFSCTRRSYDSRMMTTQCGAFRVRNVNFCACDAPTTLASTTNQCGACSGSPQLESYNYLLEYIVTVYYGHLGTNQKCPD